MLTGHPPKKKERVTENSCPVTFGQMRKTLGHSRPKLAPIRILLDSGASKSIVFNKVAKKLRIRRDKTRTTWTTLAGQFETNKRTQVIFKLNEFDEHVTVKHEFTVCDQQSNYDMIIGVDLMTELGIVLDFKNCEMHWSHRTVAMKSRSATRQTSYQVNDSDPVLDATERMKRILDAKYEPASLEEIATMNPELSPAQQAKLLKLLRKHSTLFDGTVGIWRDEQYKIELKPDARPYHARAYPIPRAYELTLKMEVDRLVKAGILRKVNRSEWAAPTFIIPKRNGTVRFISDFMN